MRKDRINQQIECNFSFEMLYKAAFNRDLSKNIKLKLQNLPQEEINKLVLKWSKKAGWKTEERIGSNGVLYRAFYP